MPNSTRELEKILKAQPDDLAAHIALLRHYRGAKSGPTLRKRIENIVWMIEHEPANQRAWLGEYSAPYAQCDEEYESIKCAWLKKIDEFPDNSRVLEHASFAFAEREFQFSLELLQRALIFEPDGQLLHYQIASGCFMRVRFVKDLARDLENESLVIRHGKRMIELQSSDYMPLLYMTLEQVGLCAWMLNELDTMDWCARRLTELTRDHNWAEFFKQTGPALKCLLLLETGQSETASDALIALSPQGYLADSTLVLMREFFLKGHQTLVISALKRFRQVNKISDTSSWSKELKAGRMPDEWHFGTRLKPPLS